jgi:acyl-coenzyme A thioesterase PaaI-like protein
MRYAEPLLGLGALHGGTVGALLESAATLELARRQEPRATVSVISLTVQFLRAGRPEDTFARACITRQGRRVANVSAEAWQGDRTRLIATACASFSIEPRG